MGIETVAVYSEADRDSQHVLFADEAYEIGPAPSTESYLRIDKIIEVVKKSNAEAVHPGYGFLSESANFAQALKDNNVTFIGATVKNIQAMGDKISSRNLMEKVGVPVVPGSPGAVANAEEAVEVAKAIGYPVMIKASAGGGGKGIRVVLDPKNLKNAFNACQSEGRNYFNDDTVFIERFIQNPKHIEIQIFGDSHGNVVHLYDRECSVQRRHQKVIEESPSVSVSDEIREKMGQVAVAAGKSINYIGAGTVEFIFDNNSKEFFFMEMNTRLQVEHPVTEGVTGVDLVKEQILVAAGQPFSFKQEEIKQTGHAIELRICAEDPVTFLPSAGRIVRCRVPQGPFVRFDSYIYSGCNVPIYYDPMIGKLIVWGPDRNVCIARLKRALAEFAVAGIKTNVILLKNILDHEKFLSGTYTTQFVDKELAISDSKTFFKYVDDEVFLISAAINAYKENQGRRVIDFKQGKKWRISSRQKSMMRY